MSTARQLVDRLLESPFIIDQEQPLPRVAEVVVDAEGNVRLTFDHKDLLAPDSTIFEKDSDTAAKLIKLAEPLMPTHFGWRTGEIPYEALLDVPGLGDDVKLSLQQTVAADFSTDMIRRCALSHGDYSGLTLRDVAREFPRAIISYGASPSRHIAYLGYVNFRLRLLDKAGYLKWFNVMIEKDELDTFNRKFAKMIAKKSLRQ